MWTWLLAVLLSAGPSDVPIQRPGEPAPLVLDWRAPASCPAREGVLAPLRGLLPTIADVPSEGSGRLRVIARVSEASGSWTVALELSGPEGRSERHFSASSCDDAAEATALIIAVTLDPVAVALGLGPTDERAPAPEPEPVTTIDSTTTDTDSHTATPPIDTRSQLGDGFDTSPPTARRGAPRVGLRVFGTGGWGPTRTGYGGIGGSLALFDRLWRWELAAGWSIPRVVRLDDDVVGRFDAWWVGSRGCVVPVARTIELPFCAGIEIGVVRGRGLPPTPNADQASFFWIAPTLGQGLAWVPIERLAVGPELGLQIPLTRGRFVIGDTEVQRIPSIGARVLVGMEVRLP